MKNALLGSTTSKSSQAKQQQPISNILLKRWTSQAESVMPGKQKVAAKVIIGIEAKLHQKSMMLEIQGQLLHILKPIF
jgi:hypothetical protein